MKKFNNLEDLYKNVLPALNASVSSLHRQNYVLITKEDIWNYLLEKKWIYEENLELSTIVDNILNVDGYEVSEYIKENLTIQKRNLYFKI